MRNRLLRLAAFQNPEFYKAQAMRLPVYDKPRIVACGEDHPQHIGLPRGCFSELLELLAELNVTPIVRDERVGGVPLRATFRGELRREQQIAANAMLASWPPPPHSGKQLLPPGSSRNAASMRSCSSTDGSSWISGWSGSHRFSTCRRTPSARLAVDGIARPGCSTSP
jgi:hypothetical protein